MHKARDWLLLLRLVNCRFIKLSPQKVPARSVKVLLCIENIDGSNAIAGNRPNRLRTLPH